MFEEITQVISSVGFPIFIATYFIIKLEKVIKTNTEVLVHINETIQKCKK